MLDAPHSADTVVDLSGLRCPHLLLSVIALVRQLERESRDSAESVPILQVIATDLNAPSSIAAWARQSGYPLLDMYPQSDSFNFFIQCCPAAVRATPPRSASSVA